MVRIKAENENIVIPKKIYFEMMRNVGMDGIAIPKTFKIYRHVLDSFMEYVARHDGELIRDMVSMALLEYMEKHK
jgi:hypothetical protein